MADDEFDPHFVAGETHRFAPMQMIRLRCVRQRMTPTKISWPVVVGRDAPWVAVWISTRFRPVCVFPWRLACKKIQTRDSMRAIPRRDGNSEAAHVATRHDHP